MAETLQERFAPPVPAQTIPQLQVVTAPKDRSPSLGKLGEALAKAQGQMRGASKDRANPYYSSTYADLASVWEAIRKPLSDNGLSVVQRTSCDKGGVTVETLLLHASGEFISDSCWVPVVPQTKKDGTELRINAQSYGSAITYARRYSLSAVVGVAAEDDDGNAASAAEQPTHPRSQSARPPTEDQRPDPSPPIEGFHPESTEGTRPPPTLMTVSKGTKVSTRDMDAKTLGYCLKRAKDSLAGPVTEYTERNRRDAAILEAESRWRTDNGL